MRRSGSCSWPWLSWRCSWTSSRGWCSGWRMLSIVLSWTRIGGSRSSRRSTRGASSCCCSSVEVFCVQIPSVRERYVSVLKVSPSPGVLTEQMDEGLAGRQRQYEGWIHNISKELSQYKAANLELSSKLRELCASTNQPKEHLKGQVTFF